MRLGLGVIAVALAFAACVGPTFIVQQYKGPVRERETIAILRVNGADSVRLLTLDNEDVAAPLESDSRLHIEMLPGKHEVTVANAKAPSERYDPLSFQAEANHVYRVVFAENGARIFDVDRANDKPLGDVTVAVPREEPLPPVPRPKKAPAAPPSEDAGASDPATMDAGAP